MVRVLVTLVRHGCTIANSTNVVQGHTDSALTDLGQQQARTLGEHFEDVTWSAVLASDTGRAVATCGIILEENKRAQNVTLPIKHMDVLRERNFGPFENQNGWVDVDLGHEGVETHEQMAARAHTFFSTIHSHLPPPDTTPDPLNLPKKADDVDVDHNLMVVSHGGTIATLIKYLKKKHDMAVGEEVHHAMVANCAYSSFVLDLAEDGSIRSADLRCMNISA